MLLSHAITQTIFSVEEEPFSFSNKDKSEGMFPNIIRIET